MLAVSAAMALAGSAIFPPPRESVSAGQLGGPAQLFSTDDYPASAIRNAEEGLVAVDIEIDIDGKVAACKVDQSSGSTTLDGATCEIITRRARYSPARDNEGTAIPGHDHVRIRWVLPVTPYLSRTVDSLLSFDRVGNLRTCDDRAGGLSVGCAEAGPAIYASFGGDTATAAKSRAGRTLAYRQIVDTGVGASVPPIPAGWRAYGQGR